MGTWVGIDIAKHSHKLLALDNAGKRCGRVLSFDNSHDGFNAAVDYLHTLKEGPLEIGLEATGPYWLALYDYLTSQAFSVTVFNPLQVNSYRKTGLRKAKSDTVDAFWIADFLRTGIGHGQYIADQETDTLKELSRYRFSLMDHICDHKRRIVGMLDRVFPEYEKQFSDVFLASSKKLLETATTPEEVLALDLNELTELLRKSSRGRFGADKAQQIQSAAQNSIGVRGLADAAKIEICSLLEIINFLEGQVQDLEAQLTQLLSQMDQMVTTCPGIGIVLGATIIGEIGDINRFDSAKALVAFAGLDASVYQSGEFTGTQMHISKRGSPHLRRALWLIATNAHREDPSLSDYYAKKRAEGKHHNTVICAIARKMAGRIYAVWKGNQPYRMTGPTQEASTNAGEN